MSPGRTSAAADPSATRTGTATRSASDSAVSSAGSRSRTSVNGSPRRMGAASSDLIAAHAIDTTLETFESLYARALGLPTLTPALAA